MKRQSKFAISSIITKSKLPLIRTNLLVTFFAIGYIPQSYCQILALKVVILTTRLKSNHYYYINIDTNIIKDVSVTLTNIVYKKFISILP